MSKDEAPTTAPVLFRVEIERLTAEMSKAGYRVLFERVNNSDLGRSAWTMWVSLSLASDTLVFTMTDPVGRTDYYDVTERQRRYQRLSRGGEIGEKG